jgi:hypothetical protein
MAMVAKQSVSITSFFTIAEWARKFGSNAKRAVVTSAANGPASFQLQQASSAPSKTPRMTNIRRDFWINSSALFPSVR